MGWGGGASRCSRCSRCSSWSQKHSSCAHTEATASLTFGVLTVISCVVRMLCDLCPLSLLLPMPVLLAAELCWLLGMLRMSSKEMRGGESADAMTRCRVRRLNCWSCFKVLELGRVEVVEVLEAVGRVSRKKKGMQTRIG